MALLMGWKTTIRQSKCPWRDPLRRKDDRRRRKAPWRQPLHGRLSLSNKSPVAGESFAGSLAAGNSRVRFQQVT
jgi:hypothetical protein